MLDGIFKKQLMKGASDDAALEIVARNNSLEKFKFESRKEEEKNLGSRSCFDWKNK